VYKVSTRAKGARVPIYAGPIVFDCITNIVRMWWTHHMFDEIIVSEVKHTERIK